MGECVEWIGSTRMRMPERCESRERESSLYSICILLFVLESSNVSFNLVGKRQICWHFFFLMIFFPNGHLSVSSHKTKIKQNDYCWFTDKTDDDFVEFRWQATSLHKAHPDWSDTNANTNFGFIKYSERIVHMCFITSFTTSPCLIFHQMLNCVQITCVI